MIAFGFGLDDVGVPLVGVFVVGLDVALVGDGVVMPLFLSLVAVALTGSLTVDTLIGSLSVYKRSVFIVVEGMPGAWIETY